MLDEHHYSIQVFRQSTTSPSFSTSKVPASSGCQWSPVIGTLAIIAISCCGELMLIPPPSNRGPFRGQVCWWTQRPGARNSPSGWRLRSACANIASSSQYIKFDRPSCRISSAKSVMIASRCDKFGTPEPLTRRLPWFCCGT